MLASSCVSRQFILNFKGKCANFTHHCLLRSLGKKKNLKKLWKAWQQFLLLSLYQWSKCIVGNKSTLLWRGRKDCRNKLVTTYRIFRTISRSFFSCLAAPAAYTPNRLIYWIVSDCVQNTANRWHCIQSWQLKTAVPPKKKKVTATGRMRHVTLQDVVGWMDTAWASVTTDNQLILMESLRTARSTTCCFIDTKHFHRSWRTCLTATQRMKTSVDKSDLYIGATYSP